jgi:hypothetical protein
VEVLLATRDGANIEHVASNKCIADIKSDPNYFNPSSVHLMSEAFELEDLYSTSSKLVRALDKPWKFSDVLEARARSRAEDKLRRAVMFSREENYKEAIASCCDSIDLHPTADAFVTRGAAYANIGVLNLAIKDFKEALRLDPDHANASSYLAATLNKISALHAPASDLTEIRDGEDGVSISDSKTKSKSSEVFIQNESEPLSTIDRLQRDLASSLSGRRRSRSRSASSSASSSHSSASSSSSYTSSSESAGGGSRSRAKRQRDESTDKGDSKELKKSKDKKRSKRSRKEDRKKSKKRRKDSKKEKKHKKLKKGKRRRRSSSTGSDTSSQALGSGAGLDANRIGYAMITSTAANDDSTAVHPILQRKVHKLWG